ncbi:MAG: hypothetical protein K2X01_02880 [Cyanobacteria bacterium]|nr:hypothetical protein [Cyanobacteriota bacterium]
MTSLSNIRFAGTRIQAELPLVHKGHEPAPIGVTVTIDPKDPTLRNDQVVISGSATTKQPVVLTDGGLATLIRSLNETPNNIPAQQDVLRTIRQLVGNFISYYQGDKTGFEAVNTALTEQEALNVLPGPSAQSPYVFGFKNQAAQNQE